MNQDRLLTIIQKLENDIARVEDAMQSAHLAIKRLMADMKSTGLPNDSELPTADDVRGILRTYPSNYEVKRGDDQARPL